jgi:hypothetical protein
MVARIAQRHIVLPRLHIVHIFVIGWLYVVIMIAIVSDSILKGVLRFLLLGALPCGLYFWFMLRRRTAERDAANEATLTAATESVQTCEDATRNRSELPPK